MLSRTAPASAPATPGPATPGPGNASSANAGRVLLIASNFPPVRGGSAVVYDMLAQHAGGRITVMAPRRGYHDGLPLIGWREHDRRAPYPVIRRDLLRTELADDGTGGGLSRARFRLRDLAIRTGLFAAVSRLILTGGVRAVCVGELVAGGWLLNALLVFPWVRRIVYVHGEEITTRDGYDDDFTRRRRYLAAADKVVVVSRFTRDAVAGLLGPAAAAAPIVLIENGVDTRRFRPGPKRADLLAFYGLERAFVFVSVCRLLEKKGIDHAIRAFGQLWRDDPALRYLVVGEGAWRPMFEQIAAREGVTDAVIFTGLVAEEDLVDHYRLGDVFVMPNRELANGDTEGFGLVFLEANGCGLPVIAGDAGGSPDAVTDQVNGLVVDGRDLGAIEAAMRRLRADAGLRAALAEGGARAAAAADWAGRAERFVEVCGG